jgi:DNA-binding SARP family transcriptional activator
MTLPEFTEILAQGVTGILATWLGLTVAVRAPRVPAARVFGLVALFLVSWSVAIIVQRFSPEAGVDRVANALEEIGAFGVIAATLHIAVALSAEGRRSGLQTASVIGAYAVAGVMALPAIVNPAARFAVTPPHFELPGIPGEVFGWAWVGVRIVIFALAVTWIVLALRGAGNDVARRRQLQVALLTVGIGAVGGIARFTPPLSDTDRWVGVSLITMSVVLAAYAVFAQRIFFPADVAAKTFRYSAVAGLVVTAYVGLLVGADRLARDLLAIELPIVTAMALVVTIALFEPAADRVRGWITGRSGREAAYDRLLRALGEPILTAQRPTNAIAPALARLTRAFRLTGAFVVDADGARTASHGSFDESSPLVVRLPLESGGERLGEVAFGPKRSALPYAPDEVDLLRLAASYLAGSLRLGRREEEQVAALDRLSAERAAVATTGTALHAALVSETPTSGTALRLYALGSLRVQRGGELLRQWGGEKAGTRQAEGLFAFLFDRGERGVAKDEAIELIWPDVELDRADLAFHRTLGGLRRTLDPGRGGRDGGVISFHNDRYRLDPALVAWTDVDAFAERLAAAAEATDPDAGLRALVEARALYRGDYLDDCPFYGDSAFVEDRRELLRGRYVDLLLALGERYESRGDRGAAAAAFREARLAAGDDCPPAEAGLARLGAA